ncbi:MAG TPA: biotin synthase [Hydrogenophaga sp.]
MNSEQPDGLAVPDMDPAAARRWASRTPLSSPWLHEEVAKRMSQRLQWFRETPDSWVHWEPALGGVQAHQRLRALLPQAVNSIWSANMSHALAVTAESARWSWNPASWRRAVGSAPAATDAPAAMVWANMALHREPLPGKLMQQWFNLLRPNGFLMFSCLGPDSLKELRRLYGHMDWPDPAHAFTDMHDWGDMLVANGFAEPVMDMERITLTFTDANAYLSELRELGRNLSARRFGGLRGRQWRAALLAAIEAHVPRDADGRLLMTFEVVYGHAFRPRPRLPVTPEQSVSVDAMRAMLRDGRR